MVELNCKSLSSSIYDSLKEKTQKFVDKGNRAPGLAVVTVGDDEASHLYVKTKTEKAAYVGFVGFQYFLNGDSREDDVISLIETLNNDDKVDGILLQLPLPPHLNEKESFNHCSCFMYFYRYSIRSRLLRDRFPNLYDQCRCGHSFYQHL